MLSEIADGVFVHQSDCIQTNAVVVRGTEGALVVDPGLTDAELRCLASDIGGLGQEVVAGFSTHPDWDHGLWHAELGDAPRFATARSAASLRDLLSQEDWRAQIADGLPEEIADDVPLDLFGLVTALPDGAVELPVEGFRLRILEHRGHAPGHAALLIEDHGVLIAGDMLSDVLVPMLDLHRADTDPVEDYLAALQLLEATAARTVVPGHGSVGHDLAERVALDRAYVEALRDGRTPADPRLDAPRPGWEWVSYIHEGQAEQLAG